MISVHLACDRLVELCDWLKVISPSFLGKEQSKNNGSDLAQDGVYWGKALINCVKEF